MWKATNLRSICFLEKTQQNHLLLKRAKDLGVSKVLHDRELRSYRSGLQVHLSLLPPPGLTELLKSYLPNRKGVSSNFQPPFYEGLCETSGVKTCFFWGVGNLCAERAGWSNLAILPKGRNFGWLVDMSMIRSHGDVFFLTYPKKDISMRNCWEMRWFATCLYLLVIALWLWSFCEWWLDHLVKTCAFLMSLIVLLKGRPRSDDVLIQKWHLFQSATLAGVRKGV